MNWMDMFGLGGGEGPMGMALPPAAAQMAAQGIPPPSYGGTSMDPGDFSIGGVADPNTFVGPSTALKGSPRSPGVGGPMSLAPPIAGGGGAPQGDVGQRLQNALKGVQAPPAPAIQRISSPNAPRPTAQIKGGGLMALLQALNIGPQATDQRKLPTTLPQAWGR